MPFENNSEIEIAGLAPKDDEIAWRYMDLVSLVSLLETKSLFFRLPGFFEDPWEGCFQQHRTPLDAQKTYSGLKGFAELFGGGLFEDLVRYGVGVNCWHLNTVESEAMWKLYAKDGFGVSVHLSVGDLKECFRDVRAPVILSRVAYIDDYADASDETPNVPPFVLKRGSFRHENEMRAIVNPDELGNAGDIDLSTASSKHKGVLVEIVPEILLKRVVVSPFAEPWYVELVSLLLKRCGVTTSEVRKSLLMDNCPWRTSADATHTEDGGLAFHSKIPLSSNGFFDELKQGIAELVQSGHLTINMTNSGAPKCESE